VVSDIEVAIKPASTPGAFRVEVVRSKVGEASAQVDLDVPGLLARRGQVQQALLASGVPARRTLPEAEKTVREVGQVLFRALLGSGEVAGRYRSAAAVAAERGERLRVVLRIESPELAALPWEAMYDATVGAYVSRQDQLVRHIPVPSVPAPLRVTPPLRILGVVSAPRGLPTLDADKERDHLGRALAKTVDDGLIHLRWATQATWPGLHEELLDGPWHVLHFIGHGEFDTARDEGVLNLERESDGRADPVGAHRLVDLLRQADPIPRLVVLNSCSSATASTDDLFSGTAAALVRGGISAVSAMQYAISDQAAIAFARGFYAALARGRGVDQATSSGRVAILHSDETLEWVTPVLYLRDRDANLFDIRTTPTTGSAPTSNPASFSTPPPRGAAQEPGIIIDLTTHPTAQDPPFDANQPTPAAVHPQDAEAGDSHHLLDPLLLNPPPRPAPEPAAAVKPGPRPTAVAAADVAAPDQPARPQPGPNQSRRAPNVTLLTPTVCPAPPLRPSPSPASNPGSPPAPSRPEPRTQAQSGKPHQAPSAPAPGPSPTATPSPNAAASTGNPTPQRLRPTPQTPSSPPRTPRPASHPESTPGNRIHTQPKQPNYRANTRPDRQKPATDEPSGIKGTPPTTIQAHRPTIRPPRDWRHMFAGRRVFGLPWSVLLIPCVIVIAAPFVLRPTPVPVLAAARTVISEYASVNAVAYSPDGKTLATGSRDDTARIWALP
jgi:hypothetical protein